MFQSKFRTIALLLLIGMAVGFATTVQAQPELKGKDLRWLEEDVAALITAEEERIYRAIEKDDRKLFKEIFWKRRDPNPATKSNEFEDEFKDKSKQADKMFKQGKTKGYATDMGKVFLILGEPTSKEQGKWVYGPNPQKGIPDGLTVEFQGNRLAANEETQKALDLVKSRYITNPTVLYARNLEGRLLEPREFDPNSPAGKILKGMRETKTATADVPFEASMSYFRASEGSIYIPILYDVDDSALTWSGDTAEATVFGVVENQEGFPMYQFEEEATLQKGTDGRTLYELPIQLQPGKYTLYTGVMDKSSSTAGTKITEMEVPDYYNGELVMSSVVVYNEGKEVSEPAGTPGHAYQFGAVKFNPATHFTKEQSIGLFFFVYGLGVGADGQPKITGQYVFFRDGEKKGQTGDSDLQANESQAVGNAEIPLSIPNFDEPGAWKMQVKVTDHILKKTLRTEVDFVIDGGTE
jgi:GWxTD domain-containing protein